MPVPLNKEGWISLGSGIAAVVLFKVASLVTESDLGTIAANPRNWIASAGFGVVSAVATYLIARLQPTPPAPKP